MTPFFILIVDGSCLNFSGLSSCFNDCWIFLERNDHYLCHVHTNVTLMFTNVIKFTQVYSGILRWMFFKCTQMYSNALKRTQMHSYVLKCTLVYSGDFCDSSWLLSDSEWLCMTQRDSAWLCVTMHDFMWLGVTPRDSAWFRMTPRDSSWLRLTPRERACA
jgi:hypothetical protein